MLCAIIDSIATEKQNKRIKLFKFIPIGLFLLICALSSFYFVQESESAVITRFGVPDTVNESGPHFKIPFIETVEKVETTTRAMTLGYDEETDEAIPEDCLMITKDYNLVNVDFYIEYLVSSPIDYLYSVVQPELILKDVMRSCTRTVVSNYTVDEVLTTEKGKIQTEVKELALKKLEKMNIGLTVGNVSIQDAEPPTEEVIAAFKKVESAKQEMSTKINEANKYASEQLPLNEADVDKILQEAESKKQQRINEAKQEVALFNAMVEEYKKDSETVKMRMYFEMLQEIAPDVKIIIDGTDGNSLNLLNLE